MKLKKINEAKKFVVLYKVKKDLTNKSIKPSHVEYSSENDAKNFVKSVEKDGGKGMVVKGKLSEKSVSKNQQQFMGMVHGLQKGEIDPKDVSQDVRDAADSMKKKDAKDYASTKHKGLPTKVKKENMDELFEQMFNESGLPDRQSQADSFIDPDTDILDFDKERNERIKKEVIKKLKEENLLEFPQNWMSGRTTNNHTSKRTKERDYDDERTNFITKNSGQPDLDESVSKTKSGDLKVELNGKTYIIGYSADGYDTPYAIVLPGDDVFTSLKKPSAKKVWKLLKPIVDKWKTTNESKLDESAMGEISLIAQEAPTFKKFIQDVFKEFKDLDKSKEAITWLKSIYDDRTNESVNEGWKDWFKKKK